MGKCEVGERVAEGQVVGVHGVTQIVGVVEQLALQHLELDVDNVVREPSAVREALIVSTDDSEPVGFGSRGDRGVQANHLARRDALGHVQPLDACKEHRHQICAGGRRGRDAVDGLDEPRHLGVLDPLEELAVTAGFGGVEQVLAADRDDHLVDQRATQPAHLHHVAGGFDASVGVEHFHARPRGRAPDPDDGVGAGVAALGHLVGWHLDRNAVDVVAVESVVAHLAQVTAVEQVEHAQVEEERVVGLAGERHAATFEGRDGLLAQGCVIRHRRVTDP